MIILTLSSALVVKLAYYSKFQKEKSEGVLKDSSDPRTDAVYLIKKCLREETIKALQKAASQGNTLNISKYPNDGEKIYWFYFNKSIDLSKNNQLNFKSYDFENVELVNYPYFYFYIPDLENLKKELETYLINKIDECVDDFAEVRTKYNALLIYKLKDLSINFFDDYVKINLDVDLRIYDNKNKKLESKRNSIKEIIEIPYKRDFELISNAFKELLAKGTYPWYLFYFISLNDDIPISILKFKCLNPIEFNVTTIKEELNKILSYSGNICFSKCREKNKQPFESFDIELSNNAYLERFSIKHEFSELKYFDIFLNTNPKTPNERFRFKNNKIVNDKLIINPKSLGEYLKESDLSIPSYDVCEAYVYYDLIYSSNVSLKDRDSKYPLEFKYSFDFGLLNNRPITLAFSIQLKDNAKKISPYNLNFSDNTSKLWPRKKYNVYSYLVNDLGVYDNYNSLIDFLNREYNFKTSNLENGQIYLELDMSAFNKNYLDRLPHAYDIFCFPITVKKMKFCAFNPSNGKLICNSFVGTIGDKYPKKLIIPLSPYCSFGTIYLYNNNYSALLNIKKLKEDIYFDGDIIYFYSRIGNLLIPNKRLKSYLSDNFKKEFLNNFFKKEEFTIIPQKFNFQIARIFDKEDFIDPEFWKEKEFFNDSNSKVTMMLSPSIFGIHNEKIIYTNFSNGNVNVSIYRNINELSKIFVNSYLYGSSLFLINDSEFINKSFRGYKGDLNILNKYPFVDYDFSNYLKSKNNKELIELANNNFKTKVFFISNFGIDLNFTHLKTNYLIFPLIYSYFITSGKNEKYFLCNNPGIPIFFSGFYNPGTPILFSGSYNPGTCNGLACDLYGKSIFDLKDYEIDLDYLKNNCKDISSNMNIVNFDTVYFNREEIINMKDFINTGNGGDLLKRFGERLNAVEINKDSFKKELIKDLQTNEDIEIAKLKYDLEKYNKMLANPVYFVRQNEFEGFNMKPVAGKKIKLKVKYKNKRSFLDYLSNYKGILIIKFNCTDTSSGDTIWYISDYGFSRNSLNILSLKNYMAEWEKEVWIPVGNCKVESKLIIKGLPSLEIRDKKIDLFITNTKFSKENLYDDFKIKENLNLNNNKATILDFEKDLVEFLSNTDSNFYYYNSESPKYFDLNNLGSITSTNYDFEYNINLENNIKNMFRAASIAIVLTNNTHKLEIIRGLPPLSNKIYYVANLKNPLVFFSELIKIINDDFNSIASDLPFDIFDTDNYASNLDSIFNKVVIYKNNFIDTQSLNEINVVIDLKNDLHSNNFNKKINKNVSMILNLS